VNLRTVSEALRPGLVDPWSAYSEGKQKRKKYSKVRPWRDHQIRVVDQSGDHPVTSLTDAYRELIRLLDPLKSTSVANLRAALHILATASDADKMSILHSKGLVRSDPAAGDPRERNILPVSFASSAESSEQSPVLPRSSLSDPVVFQSIIAKMTGGLTSDNEEKESTSSLSSASVVASSLLPTEFPDSVPIHASASAARSVVWPHNFTMSTAYDTVVYSAANGTWDLIATFATSCSLVASSSSSSLKQGSDHPPTSMLVPLASQDSDSLPSSSRLTRYDYGDVRRSLQTCGLASPSKPGLSSLRGTSSSPSPADTIPKYREMQSVS
jgi:hypothetical protein